MTDDRSGTGETAGGDTERAEGDDRSGVGANAGTNDRMGTDEQMGTDDGGETTDRTGTDDGGETTDRTGTNGRRGTDDRTGPDDGAETGSGTAPSGETGPDDQSGDGEGTSRKPGERATGEGDANVLRHKRDATRYRILVEVAQRQPAVSQREIAEAIGVTAQAVSEHLRALGDAGYVNRHGRGRYEVTKEGVDWLISETDALREYVDRVTNEVIGDVEVDTAIASERISEGETVAVRMTDGVLTADPYDEATDAGATAIAVTDADAGTDVGVAEFEGVVDYELGRVTALEVPGVREGGSRAVDPTTIRAHAADHDLLVASGVEALVAVRNADLTPDARFGTPGVVGEVVAKGLDVLLVVVTDELGDHTDRLRDLSVAYEVVEPDRD